MEKETYEAPEFEVIVLESEGILCMSGVEIDPGQNPDVDYGDGDDMWGKSGSRNW